MSVRVILYSADDIMIMASCEPGLRVKLRHGNSLAMESVGQPDNERWGCSERVN